MARAVYPTAAGDEEGVPGVRQENRAAGEYAQRGKIDLSADAPGSFSTGPTRTT
jgi:hypothetical protein